MWMEDFISGGCRLLSGKVQVHNLLTAGNTVIPIEVKSKRGATISLNHFMDEFIPPYAYKLVAGNVEVSDTKITLPLYMAMFL